MTYSFSGSGGGGRGGGGADEKKLPRKLPRRCDVCEVVVFATDAGGFGTVVLLLLSIGAGSVVIRVVALLHTNAINIKPQCKMRKARIHTSKVEGVTRNHRQ